GVWCFQAEDGIRGRSVTGVQTCALPILDDYLDGRECDVDAICDGQDVLLPGIMEHIEHAGVHSGDSMAVYPPRNFMDEVTDKIKIGRASCRERVEGSMGERGREQKKE